MEQLQASGVPTGPVLNAKQMLADPHLRARGLFEAVEHPPETGLGRREYLGRGWKLSGNDIHIKQPAPTLGEANEYILGDVLGLTPVEIAELCQVNALGQTLVRSANSVNSAPGASGGAGLDRCS
jgi:crotonobetainyl-CoA:carnitine CoA-transferase CaiB-like acyl-CoA transferase